MLATTLPIGALSNQVGTVVKLVRFLMLGPVVLGLSLLTRDLRESLIEFCLLLELLDPRLLRSELGLVLSAQLLADFGVKLTPHVEPTNRSQWVRVHERGAEALLEPGVPGSVGRILLNLANLVFALVLALHLTLVLALCDRVRSVERVGHGDGLVDLGNGIFVGHGLSPQSMVE
jgi:hypothetical protein